MLTSRQRAKLMSAAQGIEPVGQVGKDGIGENMLKGLSDCLEARELIKVTVLDNCASDPGDVGRELAERLGAECVQVIGRKAVLYRRSQRKGFKHIKI